MKKGLLMVLIIISVIISIPLAAAKDKTETKMNLNTETSEDGIYLTWDNVGDYYQIYKFDEMIWEGTSTQYNDNNVESNKRYKYSVLAYENNNLIESVKLSVKSLDFKTEDYFIEKVNKGIKDILADVNIQSTSDQTSVHLKWSKFASNFKEYELYRDGILITTTNKNEFIDHNVSPNTEYRYNVIAHIKLNKNEIEKIKKEKEKQNIKLTKEQENNLYDSYDLGLYVTTANHNHALSSKKKVGISAEEEPESYLFQYTTFIPDIKYVPIPWQLEVTTLGEGEYLNGNNRGFNRSSSSFKTRTSLEIDYSLFRPNPEVEVGETIMYDKDYNIIYRKTIDPKYWYVDVDVKTNTSTSKSVQLGHDIGLAYLEWITPDISYLYDVSTTSTGQWSVYGRHDKTPAHEFYVYHVNRFGSGSWKTIFQHGFDGDFSHLDDLGFQQWHFDISS
ncbi:hypothetical protein [Chengkuizengella axinellae]|uniref:Fibronectin type III domain-containing protein n=1 Tax=Chengkuizengella axinellae TaxID=3064388 RepID=A0ABT9J1D3_9BACL|nr:hypothetical protein [Chengkuizengella sp. 2205SS18-9]MDP5275408.1 hypothetical protein [Chengkuizengella sp. 2205SS18-9]